MLIAFRIRDRNNFDFYHFGTMACAWHRQVRLASLAAAKHTPQKSKQRNDRKTE